MQLALTAIVLVSLARTAAAAPDTEDAWLAGLTDRVIADLTAGKPLVVEVHVPLCESTIIACGNSKLGDGDNPDTNLYWSTTPGFGEWFARRGSGWKRILKQTAATTGDADILAVHVYRRAVRTPPHGRSVARRPSSRSRSWSAAGAAPRSIARSRPTRKMSPDRSRAR